MNDNALDPGSAHRLVGRWREIDQVLQIGEDAVAQITGGSMQPCRHNCVTTSDETVPVDVAQLAEARLQARLAKDWRKSDELRDELAARGWEARDTKDGQKITRRTGV